MKSFNNITFKTTAKEDFVNIVIQTSLVDLLERIVKVEDEKGKVDKTIPGEILIEKIENKGLESPVIINIDEEVDTIIYTYKDESRPTTKAPIDTLIDFAKDNNLLTDFITDEKIKGIAQELILQKGYNTKISVSRWEYVSLVNKNDWFDRFKIPQNSNPEEAFSYLIKYYEINEKLSRYESRFIMSLYDQLINKAIEHINPLILPMELKILQLLK